MSPNRRQTRGVLWDVLAPWVRWPLHSPRRLFTVLAGVVLAAVLWHVVAGSATEAASPATSPSGTGSPTGSATAYTGTPSSAAASPAPAPTSTPVPAGSSPAAPPATGATGVPVKSESVPPPPAPVGSAEAAKGFVTAWARPSLPAQQWLAGVRGYVTPELERTISYTDPSRIPASAVTGPAAMVEVLPDGTAASFDVPTNAGAVRVDLALLKGRWLATDIVPVAATAPGD